MKKLFLTLIAISLSWITTAQIEPDIIYPSGSGTIAPAVYPFDGSYGYTYNTSIYNKSNIQVSGNITDLYFYVATPCSDSVTVTIKLEELNNAEFGGYDTWGGISTNGFQVYQHKVAFNTIGFHRFDLDVNYNYDSSYHLGVYISCAWGGNGPASPPTFACENVNSGTDFVNMTWGQDNSFPTSQLSQLTNHLPYIGLRFNAPQAAVISGAMSDCSEAELLAIAFGAGEKILIATNHNGSFSSPSGGHSYSAGDTLYDGSEVVYSGTAGTIVHSGIAAGQHVYYKAWAYDEYNIYSSTGGSTDFSSQYNIPYQTNFDGGSGLPNGFSGGWENLPNHGSNDNGLVAELTPSITVLHASSPYFCELTADSKFTFQYRIVNIAGYPSTATPANEIDSILVKMLNPTSGTYSTIYSISSSNHLASTNFATVEIPVGAFEGGLTRIMISAYSGTGSYYVDIDNFAITDPSSINEEQKSNLIVYPNPTNDFCSLHAEQGDQICIFDSKGIEVLRVTATQEGVVTIPVQKLGSGLYFIRIFGKAQQSGRFIKE